MQTRVIIVLTLTSIQKREKKNAIFESHLSHLPLNVSVVQLFIDSSVNFKEQKISAGLFANSFYVCRVGSIPVDIWSDFLYCASDLFRIAQCLDFVGQPVQYELLI